jgi:hypothetical protein
MAEPLRKAHPIQSRFCPAMPLSPSDSGIGQRQFHILHGAGSRQKRGHLEDKADLAAAHGRARIFVEVGDLATV